MISGDHARTMLDKLEPGLALQVQRTANAEFLDYQETRPGADYRTFIDAFMQGAYFFCSDDDEPGNRDPDPEPTLTGAA